MSLEVIRAAAEGGPAALVTVMATRGSVPRHAGSRMLVRAPAPTAGTGAAAGAVTVGTVGGGRGEAAAVEAAIRAISERSCRIITVEMQGTEATGPDMVCGGISTLLVEPILDRVVYEAVHRAQEAGRRVVLVKELSAVGPGAAGAVPVALLEESVPPPAGFRGDSQTAAQCMATGKPVLADEPALFYDPLFPREKLLVLGGGHVGRVLASMASEMDFDVTVVDDRPDFTSAGRFPQAVRTVCAGYAEAVKAFPFDSATYAVIVTRGHLFDLECIRAVLGRTYRYAGFIGSARKSKLLRAQALSDGFDPSRVQALRGPIGIDIAAETPAEIAVSILAQIVAVRRNAAATFAVPKTGEAQTGGAHL